MPELAGLDPSAAARLLVAVGAYRQLHGEGPSWRQAARSAGWQWQEVRTDCGRPSSPQLAGRMYALRRAGLLTFSRETGSLDVTSAGRRWALSVLSPGRVDRARGLR